MDINITVKSETTIQSQSISQKPFIRFIQNINNINATINQVIFESHIAVQDFLNHISVAESISLPFFNSSLTLSNISIFASIAIQIESIRPAIEAKVSTIEKIFTINNIAKTYKNKDIDANNHDNL
ncbi:MAG: hypothetical protein P1U46_02725 [Patescibacteria group bacterium]|nr:hypothetical protein [Patescibacteria group bacterium]